MYIYLQSMRRFVIVLTTQDFVYIIYTQKEEPLLLLISKILH